MVEVIVDMYSRETLQVDVKSQFLDALALSKKGKKQREELA